MTEKERDFVAQKKREKEGRSKKGFLAGLFGGGGGCGCCCNIQIVPEEEVDNQRISAEAEEEKK